MPKFYENQFRMTDVKELDFISEHYQDLGILEDNTLSEEQAEKIID